MWSGTLNTRHCPQAFTLHSRDVRTPVSPAPPPASTPEQQRRISNASASTSSAPTANKWYNTPGLARMSGHLVVDGTGAPLQSDDFRIAGNLEAAGIPLALRKNCVLFYAPDTEELAQKVAQESGGTITLGKIKWRWVILSRMHLPPSQLCFQHVSLPLHWASRAQNAFPALRLQEVC